MRRLLATALASAVTAALFFGCGSGGGDCYPTDWEGCTCADGARGYHQCGSLGDAYGACDCSGTTPGAAAPLTDAGPGDAGVLAPFLAICAVSAECESGICYAFNAKGPHCTIACNADADCPAPSPGCSHMGVCKAQ
jgi:hypothetical protein